MTIKYLLLFSLLINFCLTEILCQFSDQNIFQELNGKVKSIKMKSFYMDDATLEFDTSLLNLSRPFRLVKMTNYNEYGKRIKEESEYYDKDSNLKGFSTTLWTYDISGNELKIIINSSDTILNCVYDYYYNSEGNLIRQVFNCNNTMRNYTIDYIYTFDEQNRIFEIYKKNDTDDIIREEIEEIEYLNSQEKRSVFYINKRDKKIKKLESHFDNDGKLIFKGSYKNGSLAFVESYSYDRNGRIDYRIMSQSRDGLGAYYIDYVYSENGGLSKLNIYNLKEEIFEPRYEYQIGKKGDSYLFEEEIVDTYILQTQLYKRKFRKKRLSMFRILDKYRNEILVYDPNFRGKPSGEKLYVREITYFE